MHALRCMHSYMTLFFTETSISQKIRSSHLFSHFIALLLQILGGRMHGPSLLTSNFWGNVHPVPPKSPPMGTVPSKFVVGTTHAYVPPIFGKHVIETCKYLRNTL